ncbi:MAG: baseplate multidomain protein megatron [Devosia sp.]
MKGASWSVAGISRAMAEVVSTHGDGPAYGGTPSDASVRAAIADLRARGLAVTLYPMLLMDIPEGNPLGQPAYPWRGRISGAAADVAGFVGTAADWGLRRMVRRYAALAAETGAEALVLASELVGMTTVREADGFPFVDALVALAAEARAIAPAVQLTYAADWSEYHGFQPPDAPGDKYFHLDPLWASPDIAAVGIDNYMPLTDWRDGEAHADFALWDGPHDLGYLTAGIAGGEGFDWFYAADADRLAGVRTPIVDGAHGEHWVWRFKDLGGWWGNPHHDRVGGVRSPTPTAWVPGSKPVWFTELGCGAVDKGANQPNVFPDGKSAEGGRPYFSSGAPDGLLQRQFLRAQLSYWADSPMVERVTLWTWDARPYPAFPAEAETWSDAPNHAAGQWLTGRLGTLASDELAAAVAADWDTELSGAAALPLVHGLTVEGVVSARAALEGMLGASGLSVRDGEAGLALVAPSPRAVVAVDDAVVADGPMRSRRRPDPSEAVGRLALGYVDRERDYLAGTATALLAEAGAVAAQQAGLVLDAAGARTAAERALVAASVGRDTLELTLPPSFAALEVGDVLAVDGEGEGPFEITEVRDGLARRVSARAVPPVLHPAVLSERVSRPGGAPPALAEPLLVAAHLPGEASSTGVSRLLLAVWASPWPGSVEVQLASTGATLARLTRPAAFGELLTPLAPGPLALWDRQALTVQLYGGHLADVEELAALAGSNRLALETDAGWEVIGFANAELVGAGTYRLTRLLRGQGGTAVGAAAPGAGVAVLDEAVAVLPVEPGWVGDALALRAFAGRRDAEGTEFAAEIGLAPLAPLPPGHLRGARDGSGDVTLGWIRRSRADAGSWAGLEVGLDYPPEAYRVTIFDGAVPVREFEVAAPAAAYPAAAQLADFGTLPAAFAFSVSQLGAELGPGPTVTGAFDA